MRNHSIRWLVVLALVIFGMGVFTSTAPAKDIIFMDLSDYTGPVAGLALPGSMGTEDYLKYINNKGGVEGLKIKYMGIDTRYDVARAISAFKRQRRNKQVVAVGIVSTPVGKMMQALTKKEKLVVHVPGDGEFQAHPGNFFTWGPVYQDAFAATIDWIMDDWEKKGESGKPKVAVLSWDNAYGREMLRGGKEYAEMKGAQLLPSELFPTGTLKHDVYLTRLDKAGANYVYVGGVDPVQTNVMRDATALGLTEKIQFISDYWGPTALGISLHPKALEGMVVVSFFLRGQEAFDHPLLKELWTTVRKQPMDKFNEGYGIGVGAGINLVGAVTDTVKRVGKNKVTREEVHNSYLRLTGLDRQGLAGRCTYSPTRRAGADVVKFYKVTGGKIVPITDWVQTPDAVSMHKWK
ncbi:MAG: ABC transporter substrate-binding protein [Desulfobacterales bacterium]|nr:MAG: ABC transporter substrate-binding protein [Desulfobacterales bacterium]